MRRRRRDLRSAAILVLAALPGCTRSSAAPAPLPPSPSLSAVTMAEYRIDAPAELPAGRAIFRVDNQGRIEHQVQVLELPEGFPATFDEQFRSENRLALLPIMNVPRQAPGATSVFALDLSPGRYGLACFLVDADGASHASRGMTAIVTVR